MFHRTGRYRGKSNHTQTQSEAAKSQAAAKQNVVVAEGEVIESLPNTLFRVKLKEVDTVVLCYLSGKMRKNYIKILPGDKVRLEITPYDPGRGRIIYRI